MTDLTIGVPVHNGEGMIEATLDALLAQTYSNFVLAVSDNASTDATPEILARYAQRDARIRVVRQTEKLGMAANFSYLIEHAQTPLFGFCSVDDIPQPTYVERCRAGLLAAPNAMICCCDFIYVTQAGERWKYMEILDTVGCDVDARLHRLMSRYQSAVYGIGWRERMQICMLPSVRYGADVTWDAESLCLWEIAGLHEPLMHLRHVQKTAEEYAQSLGDSGPVTSTPLSQLLGDVGAGVFTRIPDQKEARQLIKTMARTVAFENMVLCEGVLDERGLQRFTLDDAERFALFEQLLLGKAAPQSEEPARA